MRKSKGISTWVAVVALGVGVLVTLGCSGKNTKFPTQPPARNLTVPVTTTLVVASFEVNDESPDILVRGFMDTSTGDPVRWRWTFGDGRASNEQHPIHKFKKPGLYAVTLTVENRISRDSTTQFVTIEEEEEEGEGEGEGEAEAAAEGGAEPPEGEG